MNADRWARVKDVFHAALERPQQERAAFVSQVCDGDAALSAEVERLLQAHADAGSFIDTTSAQRSTTAAASAETVSPAIPTTIGHYKITRLIGVGGMGAVYAARDVELGRDVAVKISSDDNPDARVRLRREAQHASRLNHPHICTIHEVGVSDGCAYIVMEYVEGQSLSDAIPSGGLDAERVLRYGSQIADGLAHAHHHGVSHGDLKSENVVITREGRAKILDFGLARRLPTQQLRELSESRESVNGRNVISGTLSTMAPEVLRGEGADERSDIWALGVLLYEMASGVRPFVGATGFEITGSILHKAPSPLPARVLAALQSVIDKCLAKNPSERYQRAGEVRAALEALRAERPHPFISRRVAVVAVVALAAVIAAVLLGVRLRESRAPVAVGASGRPAIAVMPFDNIGAGENPDAAWLSRGVPSMLVTGLAQTRGLEIVSTQRLQGAVKQMGAASLDSLDRSEVADVARRAGAGAVVVGSVFRSGNEIRIDAQVEDLSSGRVLAAQTVRGTDVFALSDQLAGRIREVIGLGDASDIRHVADMSSRSLEAYRLYSEGMDAFANVRWEEAVRALDAAVEHDPTFAQAHLSLAYVHEEEGRTVAYRRHLQEAARHSNRLTERERLLVRVLTARDAGNSAEASRLLDEAQARFPDMENVCVPALALYESLTGTVPNPDKYVSTTARAVEALPTSTSVRNIHGYALLSVGRFADAVREFETYARIAPREPNPYDSLGEVHLVMGFPDKASEYYSRALTIDPTFASGNGRAWAYAMLGRYDEALAQDISLQWVGALLLSRVGRYREADQLIAESRREAEEHENFAKQGALHIQAGFVAVERRDYRRALQEARAAVRLFQRLPSEQRRVYLVVADLLAGLAELGNRNIDSARAHAASLKRSYDASVVAQKWWRAVLEGEIDLALSDHQNAATTFAAGEPPQKMWFLFHAVPFNVFANSLLSRDWAARVQKARGDLDGATQTYRHLLTVGPDQKWTTPLEPRYVLELARLLEQKGDRKAALAEYQRFLELWKGADADLPEAAEARRALARLRQRVARLRADTDS